jgi:hypothetical protein
MHTLTPEDSVLLCLVRNESLSQALRLCGSRKLFQTAAVNKVLGPLADGLLNDEDIDEDWKRFGAIVALGAEKEKTRYSIALQKTVELLDSVGISTIVIKGISLAMGRTRDCGDIDLLISENQIVNAISTLENASYQYVGFERNQYIKKNEYRNWQKLSRWSIQFEFREPSTGMLVELHTAFFETGRMYSEDLSSLRSAMPEFISRSVIDPETGYRFLALEDRALLLALHAGIKRSPSRKSFILRHLLDLRSLIAAGLNWELLIEKAARFEASRHLLLLARLYETTTTFPIGGSIIADIKSSLSSKSIRMTRLHLRCLRHLGSYSSFYCFLYQLKSPFVFPSTHVARLRAALVLPLILPPPYQIIQTYNISIRSPALFLLYLLEPIKWIYVILSKILKARDS